MHIMYFTEQPNKAYPMAESDAVGYSSLLFSNRHFDPVAGSRLYEEYLKKYLLVEEMGFDGIMLNEHHAAPFCMQAKANIWASILAAMTSRIKLVILGNPLPLADNPVRIAEELAMIDMISKGRLVSGFVRGGGQESLATNISPAYNRERFAEAHDLIVKAWTQPGPFRWEGTHYHQRVVNPWVLPLQQPHPRIWIPGAISRETVRFAAQHAYPYFALNTSIKDTQTIFAEYDEFAKECGYTAGTEHKGYLIRFHVAETDEKALQAARNFLWMMGEFAGRVKPVWAGPSGYFSPSQRQAFVEFVAGQSQSPARPKKSFEQQVADLQIIAGSPKTVVAALRRSLEAMRPGMLGLFCDDGHMTLEDSRTNIRLLGEEVIPQLREIARELDLKDPWETQSPVSLADSAAADRRVPREAA
jgi:alkanesulfonate monooxygenase SsuD/methylene tetrahydromethanopterin reductase-like flavin-dependent oxidoreductase (luciferase family)